MASPSRPFIQQLGTSLAGEIIANAVSIGAVYATESLLPKQTKQLTDLLALRMVDSGVEPALAERRAHKIVDVTIMNIAGLTNMGTQMLLRRARIPAAELPGFGHEIGRQLAGRALGTATAIGALSTAEEYLPNRMRGGEARIARLLGGHPEAAEPDAADRRKMRFAELLMSSAVQSAGAILGNTPAQLLYERVTQGAALAK